MPRECKMCQVRPRSPCQAARQPSFLHHRGGLSHRSSAPGIAKPATQKPQTVNHSIPAAPPATLRPIWDSGRRTSASWHRDKPIGPRKRPELTSTLSILLDGIRRPKAAGQPRKKEKERQRHSDTASVDTRRAPRILQRTPLWVH